MDRRRPPLLRFEALELLDEIKLELHGNPRRELECDVLMRVCAAVSALFRDQSNGRRCINPLPCGQHETVQPRLESIPLEFEGFEVWIIGTLPTAKKLNRIAISQPVLQHVVRALSILVTRNIGNAEIITTVDGQH